ncbi:MAG TPA: membrane dipeptidase [Armatimonadota bacterium]|nr:membrane dipeptidase [Armatimonadota bacterium]
MNTSDHARRLHKRAIIIDGHNDSLVLRLSRDESMDISQRDERYHLDIPRALEGGLTAMMSMVGSAKLEQAMDLVDATWTLAEEHGDVCVYATCAVDIERAKMTGRLAMIGQLESCTCLHGRIATLRNFHRLGVRVANLTHGEGGEAHHVQEQASLFDYCTADDREQARREMKGLTAYGREVVAEINRLRMVMDLAHANDATFFEAIELSATPPIFSHGAVFEVCPHWRGLTDDQLCVLAEAGGVMGLAFYDKFIHREDPSLQRWVDGVVHVIELVGSDHIGIGADYDGLPETTVPIPPDVSRLPMVTEAMVERGLDDETILKVLGGNFMRVLREVIG